MLGGWCLCVLALHEEPPRPTPPDWGRRVHNAAGTRPAADVSRRAPHVRRGTDGRTGHSRQSQLNSVIVVPMRSGLARRRDDLSCARRLRAERFDVAIDLHGGPRSAWLTWACGAPMRIGYSIAGRTWMHTRVIGRTDDLLPRHAPPASFATPVSDRSIRSFSCTSAPATRSGDGPGGVRCGRRRARASRSGAPPQGDLRALRRRGRAGDRGPGQGTSRCRGSGLSHGRIDLGELQAVAARAAVYIGGDSDPLHIAATTQTPSVAPVGPTLAERSTPWRDPRWFAEAIDAGPLPCRPRRQRTCQPGDFRCLTGIAPDRAVAAAERALATGTRRQSSDMRTDHQVDRQGADCP